MLIRREDFGDIESLKYGSHKKVWFTCDKCDVGILQRYRTYVDQKDGKFCRSCRNKHTASRSDVKTKQSNAIKKRWEDKGYRKHMSKVLSNACKTSWNSDDGTRRGKIHNKTAYDDLREMIEKEGYKLNTTIKEYTFLNIEIKKERTVNITCPKGHSFNTFIRRWNNGNRCLECMKVEWDKIEKSFSSENYELLSEQSDYKNNKTKLIYKCPSSHIHNMSWSNWISGTRCGKCSSHISKSELDLQNFIKKNVDKNIITNDRKIIKPLELDIVIPSLKIAIEYCGLFWHSEQRGKNRNYHLYKHNKCNEAGYRLITIFEDEWLQKRELVENKLLYIIGLSNSKKLYARKCSIIEIEVKSARSFCERFHIQGYTSSTIKLGAYHNGELVAVMTFAIPSISKGRRGDLNGIWELSRFCSKYNVVGIASKMLSHFKKNYKWKEIFSFADKRWSDGNLYEKIGFEKIVDTKPNYFYFYTKQSHLDYKRFHRFNFRKQKLKSMLDIFDINKTEYENMLINDYDRIWDCGNFNFIIRKYK